MRKWREQGWGGGGTAGKGLSVADRAGPRAFSLRPAPPSDHRGLGSARVRRLLFQPKPAIKEILGAQLGRFSGAGTKKLPWGLLGARMEML